MRHSLRAVSSAAGGNAESAGMSSGRRLLAAVDQGTSSSRFIVFSADDGQVVASHQVEIGQSYPREGWVELDPVEIFESTLACMRHCGEQLTAAGLHSGQVAGVGVTNQRETTIVWDRSSGKPLHPAVVWLDTRSAAVAQRIAARTGASLLVRQKTGLPINPYFSALKIAWLMEHVEHVRNAINDGSALVGTVDSWLIWNLCKGVHVTDVTNASRYALMDLRSLQWDTELCAVFGVPPAALPSIKSCAERLGDIAVGPFAGVPLAACIGDQQSALLGQLCTEAGDAKNTYGTGTFLLVNTGTEPTVTESGLLTTVAFQLGPSSDTVYALEGAGTIGGTAVRWLRDNMNIIHSASEVEQLASSVSWTGPGACVFVPSFSGLNAPHWDPSARGTIVGITGATTKADLARAALGAVCCQTREMIDAVPHIDIRRLKVDGGMTKNKLLLQMQADLLGCTVVRSHTAECTALGAAIAAGLAQRVWTLDECRRLFDASAAPAAGHCAANVFEPAADATDQQRQRIMSRWHAAVQRAKCWPA